MRGVAGRTIVCLDRESHDNNDTFKLTGSQTRALNTSSYNYLGFASSTGGCADAAEAAIRRYGVSSAGPRHDTSTLDLHIQTEKLVARFAGTESAMVGSMGFATNSTTIPALVGKGCLIISDEFNHASIRFGARLSGASVRWFKHNDMDALESLLREVISQGQPRTHRPWKKILLIVEGLYSMEGSLVNLPHVLELKRRYKVSTLHPIIIEENPYLSSSFTCTSTRLTRSARSVPMDEVSAITLASTRAKLTFSWAHSQSRLALPVVMLPVPKTRSTESACVHMPAPTRTPSARPFLLRSSRPWAPLWVSPRPWPRPTRKIHQTPCRSSRVRTSMAQHQHRACPLGSNCPSPSSTVPMAGSVYVALRSTRGTSLLDCANSGS